MSMAIEFTRSIFLDTQVANIVRDLIEGFNKLEAHDSGNNFKPYYAYLD